ncbi:MAG TPA: hypothetical protein HPQ04_11270 [Rhodospirillaceae bacterium]|nr:hypothetical protein [Rhodospirillaceae bacterium]
MQNDDKENLKALLKLKAPKFPKKLKLAHWRRQPAWAAAIAILEDDFERVFSSLLDDYAPLESELPITSSRTLLHIYSIRDRYKDYTEYTLGRLSRIITIINGIPTDLNRPRDVDKLLKKLKAETEDFGKTVLNHVLAVKKALDKLGASIDGAHASRTRR